MYFIQKYLSSFKFDTRKKDQVLQELLEVKCIYIDIFRYMRKSNFIPDIFTVL